MLRTGRYGSNYRGGLRWLAALPGLGAMRRLLSAQDRRPLGLSVRTLLDAPNGVDLGPLERAFPRRLATQDRMIQLAPPMYLADLTRAADALMRPPPALALIGRRHVRSNNSWLHNSHRLVKGKPRCTLMMHPGDAASRSIANGTIVRVSSRVGSVEVVVEVTTDIECGVVSLPHGFGHGRDGIQLGIAAAHAGISINDLVDDQRIDVLTGTAVLNGTPVDVVPVEQHVDARTTLA
jgi:anaerobic selenocysteine-containing dehydrogenase